MTTEEIKKEIAEGKACLGIEFGSTRIKAVLINSKKEPVAGGAYDWENSLVDGIWTYSLEKVHEGISTAYAELKKDVLAQYGVKLTKLKALGISAMMHGYLAFDSAMNLLVPFRTWRNTITAQASEELSALFNYPIPERWSIAHLYQAILKGEAHVKDVAYFTTLAGYAHYMLSGQKVLGVGDASGMFPIDENTGTYNAKMVSQFDELVAPKGFAWKLGGILPKVLSAGEEAGVLSAEGAKWLDPAGDLEAGVLMAPPEGDAGTGMTATNSVAPRTGNVSAGTSVFAMVVLEKALSKAYGGKIDIVTTPDGKPTAMAHANNCTGEYDKWIKLFGEAAELLGASFSKGELYDKLITKALEAAKDAGGLVPVNYISGESITGFSEGRTIFVREQNAQLGLADFMLSQLYSAIATLRMGMDILFDEEKVSLDSLMCHGGYFKTQGVGLKLMAGAMNVKACAMSTAGEGGPWGMALLASFAAYKKDGGAEAFAPWLEKEVFCGSEKKTVEPEKEFVDGFNAFMGRYKKTLNIERAAVENL